MSSEFLEKWSDLEKDFLYNISLLEEKSMYTYREGDYFHVQSKAMRNQVDYDVLSHRVMTNVIREHVTELVIATTATIIEYIKLYGIPVMVRLEEDIIKNRLDILVREGLVKSFVLKQEGSDESHGTYYVSTLAGVDTVRRHCKVPRLTYDKNIMSECTSNILLRLVGNKISLKVLNAMQDNGCVLDHEKSSFLSTVYRKEEERKEKLFCVVECTKEVEDKSKRYGVIVEPVSYSVEKWKTEKSLEDDIKSRLGFINQAVKNLTEREEEPCDDVAVIFVIDSKKCSDRLSNSIYERCAFLFEKSLFTADAILNVNKVVNESFFAYKIGENGFEIADDGKFSVLFGENKKESVSPVRLPRSWDLPYRCRLCYQKGLVIAVTMI